MSNKLPTKIQDHLDLRLKPAKKALKYIEDNDWSLISGIVPRDSEYKLQHLLNNKNIDALISLYEIAIEDLGHPQVKSAIDIFVKFFTILEKRFIVMEKNYDWTVIFEGEKDEHEKKKAEIEFQTGVLANLTDFKHKLRKINFGEESTEINLPIHGGEVVPMMMRQIAEQQFPEIIEYTKKINKK